MWVPHWCRAALSGGMNLSDRQSHELRNFMTLNSLPHASVCFRNKTFSIDGFWFSGTVAPDLGQQPLAEQPSMLTGFAIACFSVPAAESELPTLCQRYDKHGQKLSAAARCKTFQQANRQRLRDFWKCCRRWCGANVMRFLRAMSGQTYRQCKNNCHR